VNRTFDGAAALLVVILAASPARGQTPLVVGSVRDQHGAVVAGALVTGETVQGSGASATTDASGTFALHGAGIVAVRIRCRYCESARIAVSGDQPVVAFVRRYDALSGDSPSSADLENLPYAHVESSLALRPFTLLAQSAAAYPGPTLSDRGLSSSGSLLVDDGAPAYDIVAGESPYTFVPAQFEQSATLNDATNAYLYGDQAAGGIATLQPFANGSDSEVATLGSDAIARAQVGSDSSAVALDSFSNDEESRQRGDAFAIWPLGADESVSVAGGSEQGREYQSPDNSFAGSFSFADAAFSVPRALNLSLSGVIDRGNYDWSSGAYPFSAAWSDAGFNAGIHSNGPVVGFADVGVRSSTGFDDSQVLAYGPPQVGATLDQTRADAGVSATSNDLDVTAGVGAFWIDYAGGTYGVSAPAKTSLAVPSIQAKLFPNGNWSLDLQGSGSFTLPTFVEQYLYAPYSAMPVLLARNSLQAAVLSYTDGARIRLAVEEALEDVAGAYSGKIASSGLSAIWQIAPAISLRAWTMHVSDTTEPFGSYPYDGAVAPTVNALWLTYGNGDAVRADAIYRRDLLDGLPFYHVDGSISGPVADRLRWYAGAEDRMRRTFVDLGLRFSGG
jgi:hypothetical protein